MTPVPDLPAAFPRRVQDGRPPCEIRRASLADVPALVAIEQATFKGDRITRRQFRYLLTRGNSETLVCERDGRPVAYVLVLFSKATSTARMYSIAVMPEHGGQGIGRALVGAAEAAAQSRERAYMRLEIRRDNAPSRGLFESLGYRELGVYEDYYEDHMQAVRYEKSLALDLLGNQTGKQLQHFFGLGRKLSAFGTSCAESAIHCPIGKSDRHAHVGLYTQGGCSFRIAPTTPHIGREHAPLFERAIAKSVPPGHGKALGYHHSASVSSVEHMLQGLLKVDCREVG